jgi:hypothetical protein
MQARGSKDVRSDATDLTGIRDPALELPLIHAANLPVDQRPVGRVTCSGSVENATRMIEDGHRDPEVVRPNLASRLVGDVGGGILVLEEHVADVAIDHPVGDFRHSRVGVAPHQIGVGDVECSRREGLWQRAGPPP